MNPRSPAAMLCLTASIGLAAVGASCRSEGKGATSPRPETAARDATTAPDLREIFPHVRIDRAARLVEFDGIVPIDARTPLRSGARPEVFLEVIACTPDSREHEALVVTRALPSHVHAALLLAGFEPGQPGSWTTDNGAMAAVPPTGDVLAVTIVYTDDAGRRIESPAESLVVNVGGTDHLGDRPGPRAGFVFSGSRMVEWRGREMYDADGTGVLIGLTTFGSEAVAWREVFSPESRMQAPEWIADPDRVPAAGTEVVVRVGPLK